MSSNAVNWLDCPEVERDPNRVSGAWVFRGTRVPVRALFENLRDGASVDDFLAWFPGVRHEQIEAVLNHELAMLTGAPEPHDELKSFLRIARSLKLQCPTDWSSKLGHC